MYNLVDIMIFLLTWNNFFKKFPFSHILAVWYCPLHVPQCIVKFLVRWSGWRSGWWTFIHTIIHFTWWSIQIWEICFFFFINGGWSKYFWRELERVPWTGFHIWFSEGGRSLLTGVLVTIIIVSSDSSFVSLGEMPLVIFYCFLYWNLLYFLMIVRSW